jgi:TM2 domain-containing membrane protein YozV
MGDKKYRVIFKGDVAAGVQIAEVKQKLAAGFKTDIAKIDKLFSGKRKVIKKDADLETCEKARKAFERAGAICFIEPEQEPELDTIESKPPEIPGVKPPPLPPEGSVVVRQEQGVNKVALVLLTFFLGGIGVHKFYLGKYVQGVIYFLFSWTLIPGIVAFIEFIIYACTSDERLQEKYTAKGPIAVIIIAVCAGFFVMIAIIGILAAIAIPQFMIYRDRAYQTTVISELNNLRAAEEAYYDSHKRYSDNMDDLNFVMTRPGVTIELLSADEECFEATGTIKGLRKPVLMDCTGVKGR